MFKNSLFLHIIFQRFDDVDLKNISLHYLRTQVALVGQEPRLFAGSIKQNVCLGTDEEISTERMNAALELANAKSFVDALPQVIFYESVPSFFGIGQLKLKFMWFLTLRFFMPIRGLGSLSLFFWITAD